MKIRSAIALLGMAISFALPTFAQQTNKPDPQPAPAPPTAATQEKSAVDPEVRQEIEALLVKGDEAYNKRDAAALAARYTEDAVLVGGGNKLEPHYPRQNIEQRRTLDMTSFPGEMSHELLQLYQLGIDVCAISKLSIGPWKGYGVFIFVREADGWKIRSEYDGNFD